MAQVKFATYNLLDRETSAVSVTGSADAGYPESRLYDRSIDFYWKQTASQTIDIEVDQSDSNNLAIDTLVIDRHNFNGYSMKWQWSDNGSVWNSAVTDWTQSGNEQIVKTLDTPLTHRYWRVQIVSAVNPMCTEVFMGYAYPFQVRFDEQPEEMDKSNVIWFETLGGIERSVKLGDVRYGRAYSVFLEPAQVTNWRTAISYLDEYSLPFYVIDHEGNLWLGRFVEVPGGVYPSEQQIMRRFTLMQIL